MTQGWNSTPSPFQPRRQPIFNLPQPVLWLLYFLAGIHVLRIILPSMWDAYVLFYLSVIPARLFSPDIGFLGDGQSALLSLVTYQFLHADWVHLAMNSIWLAVFGSAVAQRLDGHTIVGLLRFLVFYGLCGVAGGLLHAFLYAGSTVPLVGASASIAGLMGGALRFIFIRPSVWRQPGALVGAMDSRVLIFAGIYVLMNVITGVTTFFGEENAGQIAWQAHIAGLFAGIALFGFFDKRR